MAESKLFIIAMKISSNNFGFLNAHDSQLVRLGALAERYCHDDPNTSLIKLRQFGELLAQLTAAKTGLYDAEEQSQSDLLRRLRFERVMPVEVADLFHSLRIFGNDAAHGWQGTLSEALNGLKYARQAAIWFHRTFGDDPDFAAGPFQPPTAPTDVAASMLAELEHFKRDLLATRTAAEQARLMAEENALARQIAEERARKEAEERAIWERLAQEAEQEKLALRERLDSLQLRTQARPINLPQVIAQAESAAQQIDLDEAATRQLIDQQQTALATQGSLWNPEKGEHHWQASYDSLAGLPGRSKLSHSRRHFSIVMPVALILTTAFLGFFLLNGRQANVGQAALKYMAVQHDKGNYTLQAISSDFSDEHLLQIIPDLMRLPEPLKLNLNGTRVRNISALRRVKNLKTLNLEGTWVANIDVLKDFQGLTELSLAGTRISNVDALKELKNLRTLNLEGTRVANIDVLKDLKNLRTLNLERTRIVNVDALRNLRGLMDLSLANTHVANIDALNGMKSLRTLDLGGTSIASIDALKDVKSLTDLSLESTRVANIDALKNLNSLATLDLSETSVTNIDALKGFKSLTILNLSETSITNAGALTGRKGLSISPALKPSGIKENRKSIPR